MAFEDQIAAIGADQGVSEEERALVGQDVLGKERLGEGLGANEVWRVELGPGREGAYFKPVNGVNVTLASMFGHSRESVLLSELSAYRLAYALGPPWREVVPACVVRLIPEIDADAPGSLTGERFDDRSESVFEWAPALALRAAFFDALIANQDRSGSNLLFDASRGDLALIDHGFAFPRDGDLRHKSVLVDWRLRAGLDKLAVEEHEAVEVLSEEADLLGIGRYLDPERAEALARRVRGMRDTGRLA